MAKPKITRIKASDGPSKKDAADTPTITRKKVVVKDKKTEKIKEFWFVERRI